MTELDKIEPLKLEDLKLMTAWSPADQAESEDNRVAFIDFPIRESEIARLPRLAQDLARLAIENPKEPPHKEIRRLKLELQEAKIAISCLAASRDRWRMEARGKITPEWRALMDGAKSIEG
ncbi:hypothetical protein [Xanthobacter autotrophicus]|uniref:hypothetical protein n=1 Tax=Xanthobacter autotrophicus TaxID=280 RepID=UPI003728EB6D